MIIQDNNGNVHATCPRCKSQWRMHNNNYYECSNCRVAAYTSQKNWDIFFEFDNKYKIHWVQGHCLIYGPGKVYGEKFPLLPFDIRYDELQMYMVFS